MPRLTRPTRGYSWRLAETDGAASADAAASFLQCPSQRVMDLYEACENGNEERVVEVLVYGEHWHGLGHHLHHPRHASRVASSSGVAHENENAAATVATPARGSVREHTGGVELDRLAERANHLAAAAAESAGLVASPREMLHARGTAGRTPLLAACLGGQLGVVRLLLGESCVVYFTSRTPEETEELLMPLADEFTAFEMAQALAGGGGSRGGERGGGRHFAITTATKDGGSDLVPVATVRFTPARTIARQDLLEGARHVDDFGNTPLQCVSCFGCGTTERHIDDGLAIARTLLLHGDQPNLPKIANQWTPLHWAAYNGNRDLCAVLLDPRASLATAGGGGGEAIGRTQFSIPLLVNSDNLFAADVAGRRGLALAKEMHAVRAVREHERNEYARWRLRLDHIETLRLFAREFLTAARSLVRYVNDMNARLPRRLVAKDKAQRNKQRRRRLFTCADAVRYGQHLLYWMGCFGLEHEVRALLKMELEMPVETASGAVATSVHLRPLYVCSCEENKRQSVLHAVAVHGQPEIVRLLLSQMLFEQQHPGSAAVIARPPAQQQATAVVAPVPAGSPRSSGDDQQRTTLLDVLSLAEIGWRNYRNESPLFLAVLFLRDDVVAACRAFLSRASLAWELTNCNVEGSYIHHVASDATRRALRLDDTRHGLSCAEYVLLFDGLGKRHFKESVVESMREESVVAPSLVVTRAGHRRTAPSLGGLLRRGAATDYIVVGATERVLVQHAQALQLKIKHRGSALRSKYNAASPQLFEPFRSLQRQQVVLDIIQKNVNVKKHLKKGNLLAIFPLHDASGCQNIMRHWVLNDDRRRVFQPFVGNSLTQFLTENRTHQYEMLWPLLTYFGEKHAFYYAFLLFYTVWLVVLAVPGAVCQFFWSVGHARYVAPLFAVFTSLWATLFVERWKRKRSEIQSNFGNFKRNRSEESPEFYGDFQVESPEKAVVDTTFPKSLQLVRIYVGAPVLLTMASLAVAIFIAVKLNASSNAILRAVFPWLPPRLASYVIPVVNAVSMLVLDNVYTQVAVALTQWENHRTVWQFESMLATKLFWFKFLNAFLSLFWVAFVDKDAAALRKQLVIIMGARQIWYMVQRSMLPLLSVAHAWERAGFRLRGDAQAASSSLPSASPANAAVGKRTTASWFSLTNEWYNAELLIPETEPQSQPQPPAIVLLQELMQPSDFLMGKQMEVMLQFGYITMFVSVLPIAPLLALLSVVVSTRLDVACCTQAKRRPPFESETEVSTFMSILEFMSFAAVAVNCAVLFFTTMDDFDSLLSAAGSHWKAADASAAEGFYLDKLWVLLVLEHAVLGLKALLSLTIDDAATWVQNDEDRNDDEAKQNAQLEKERLGLLVPTSARAEAERMLSDAATPLQFDGGAIRAEAGVRGTPASSALQRVVMDKYELVVRERDAALASERQLQRQLSECLQRLKKATDKPTAGGTMRQAHGILLQAETDASGAASFALPPSNESSPPPPLATSGGKRWCRVCLVVRNAAVTPDKRCLACREFLCRACDDAVHLDDLGVREPTHFRVAVPTALSVAEAADSLVDKHEPAMAAAAPTASPSSDAAREELLRLLVPFLQLATVHGSRDGDAVAQAARSALERCAGDHALIARYLRNVARRRDHAASSASS